MAKAIGTYADKQIDNLNLLSNKFMTFFNDAEEYKNLTANKSSASAIELVEKDKAIRKEARSNKAKREYIVNKYSKLVSHLGFNIKGDNTEKISQFVDFDIIEKNCDFVIFEMLLSIMDVKVMFKKFNIPYVVESEHIRSLLKEHEIKSLLEEKYAHEGNQLSFICQLIYSIRDGNSIFDTLQYHNINDFALCSESKTYIIIGDKGYLLKFLRLKDVSKDVESLPNNMTNSKFTPKNPSVITQLESGTRILAIGHQHTPSSETYLNGRVFNLDYISTEALVKLGTIDEQIMEFIKLHYSARGRSLITGNNTNVGKTTFMLACLEHVPQYELIGIVDTNDETKLHKHYPEKITMTLIGTNDEATTLMHDNMYKASRTFFMKSEIVTPSDASNQIRLGKSFDSGMSATMHSRSAYDVMHNLTEKMIQTPMYKDHEIAESHAADVVDIIFHLERHAEDRDRIVLKNVTEIVRNSNKFDVRYKEPENIREAMRQFFNIASKALLKRVFNKNYYENKLFEYNYKNDKWDRVGQPSKSYLERFRYFNNSKVDEVKKLFNM